MPATARDRPALRSLLSLALLASGCARAAAAPPVALNAPAPAAPAPEASEPPAPLTAASILSRMADTYAHCSTYRDSGRSTSKLENGPVLFKPFQTAFARPDQFR